MAPTSVSEAVRMFSSSISMLFMPLSTQVTSFWSHSQRSAHWAGVRFTGAFSNSFMASRGKLRTSLPPRKGSMITTGKPF